jgi:hypothetical protein
MSKLGAYKLDKAFTKGVEIVLDDAPEVIFIVKLPSMYNRAYTQALYSCMDISLTSDGKVEAGTAGIMVAKYAQEEAFVDHCIVSMDGEKLPDDFIDEYPGAVEELIAKATDMATAIDEGVNESVKKSQPTSTGKGSGRDEKASILSLNEGAA